MAAKTRIFRAPAGVAVVGIDCSLTIGSESHFQGPLERNGTPTFVVGHRKVISGLSHLYTEMVPSRAAAIRIVSANRFAAAGDATTYPRFADAIILTQTTGRAFRITPARDIIVYGEAVTGRPQTPKGRTRLPVFLAGLSRPPESPLNHAVTLNQIGTSIGGKTARVGTTWRREWSVDAGGIFDPDTCAIASDHAIKALRHLPGAF